MLLYLAIFCISSTVFLYVLHHLIRGGRKGKLVDKIPGPYAWPFIGNVVQFLIPLEELWGLASKINKQYYPICRLWGFTVPMIHIYHPDDVEALLTSTKHIEKSRSYDFLRPWLGNGLLTSNGKKWHYRRKILTPGFHFNVLQQFVRIFMEQSEKLVESLCLEGDEVVPDLVPFVQQFTVNTICVYLQSYTNEKCAMSLFNSPETAMGSMSTVDCKTLDDYQSCVSKMGDITVHRLLRPWLHIDWIFRFFKKFREQVQVLKVLHGFSTNIINERKRYHNETGDQHLEGLGSGLYGFDDEHVEGRRRLAMLDLLISAQKRGADMDDEGIREEVDTFVFEGHDTTAMAICFTLMLLAENKEIQDTARAEVDAIFEGRDKSKLSMRELQSLSYLERCIKESLRLFPSVPFIARKLSEDIQLKNYLVPAGTLLHVFIRDLHRDPDFWPNPDVFDPDRFLPDQVRDRHPFAFVPFSAGPRNCIGQKFAMLELKTIIGTFLHNFYLAPIDLSSEVRMLPNLVLRSLNPIRIKLVRRLRDDR